MENKTEETLKQEIINYLKTTAGKHVLAIALTVAGVIGFRSYMVEHDARLVADSKVQAAQVQIDSLQKQKTDVDKTAKVQVIRLQADAAQVRTPAQAIAALPGVSAQLNAAPLPDAPSKVSVDVIPLYQQLNSCKQDAVSRTACGEKLQLQEKIDADKDTQIAALKKKRGFWHNVKTTAITLGVGAAAGYVIAHK